MTDKSSWFTPLNETLLPAFEAASVRQTKANFQHTASGFTGLDRLIYGLPAGEITLLSGHPSVGKTTLVLNIATAAAAENPVLFFSTTNSVQNLTGRILCASATVKNDRYLNGAMNESEWQRVRDAYNHVQDLPLMFGGHPLSTIDDLEHTVDALESSNSTPSLIIVDDINTLAPSGEYQNRYEELADLSRRLKALASEHGISVLVTAQLNRDIYWRSRTNGGLENTRPQLSDLRDSGTLEYDASTIIMLERPDLFDKDSERAGEAYLIVVKNTHGPTDLIFLAHQLHYCRFVDMP